MKGNTMNSMQQDYNSAWVKWLALLGLDIEGRRELLSELHIEITKGFDVVTRISIEELEGGFAEKEVFSKLKEALQEYLAFSVWGGYALFLIVNRIDPKVNNLIANQNTNTLGSEWLEHYSKDQNVSLLKQIDPFFCMMLEKDTQVKLNKLFAEFPELMNLPYKECSLIETFLNWSAYQGFIFGILEKKLQQKPGGEV